MGKTAWKEAWRTVTGSWARFFSISALMFLGAFALVGLKVTGPDMRATGADFFDETNLADITVTAPMGVDEDALSSVNGASVEFGYFADATVEDSLTTLRLLSAPEEISTFALTSGSMPSSSDEIALTSELEGTYDVGDTVVFADDDASALADRIFTVTGFVRSSEYLDREDIGQTTLGTGQLGGFAAVAPEAFSSPVHTMARLRFAEIEEFLPYADSYLAQLDEYRETVADALDGSAEAPYEVNDRRDFQGYLTYGDSADRIDAISQVFPVFLFAIASLVSLTTMTRMVQEQRTTNGTFAALGYSPRAIRRKYLLYGISASTLGGLIGVAVGHTLLPTVIFDAYQEVFAFPALDLGFYPVISMIAVTIAILCTVLVAAIVATRELNEVPSQLLVPKPPAAGTRILLERVRPLWKRMSFTQKITARNLFRYKRRMFMTVFGVAGCTALLILAFGVLDSITGLVNRQFNQIMHYDLISLETAQSDGDPRSVEGVEDAAAIHFEQMSVRVDGESIDQEISYIAPSEEGGLEGYVDLLDRSTQESIPLTEDGVVITEKLAKLLDVSDGDQIVLQDGDGDDVTMKVTGIAEMYAGHYVFGAISSDPNAHLIRTSEAADVDEVSAELMESPNISGIVQVTAVIKTIDSTIDGLNAVIIVLIVCAGLLAVVVIFNLTNINVSERIRELSTIKVLGFYPREVTMYIFRETLLLTVLGILAGFALGVPLHAFVINSVPPDMLMFQPDVLWTNFALSTGITFAISIVIMLAMHVRLKTIDMLDALKAQD